MSIPYLTREQVRACDKYAIEQLGIPSAVLMENAGRGAADVLRSFGVHGPVAICCGKGNNGGDGLVIARYLANWGFEVQPLLFAKPQGLTTDALLQWDIVNRMGLPTRIVGGAAIDEAEIADLFVAADWIVDALFGTGLTRPIRPPLDRVIAHINAKGQPVLAVDIPSGLDADTGLPLGPTIRATHTVTFVAPKLGFANPVAADFTGKVHVADIGISLAYLPH